MKIARSIKIQAPVDILWRVTIDVNRWPDWSPGFQSIQRLDKGPFKVGSQARIKQPGLPNTVWEVTSLTAAQEFTWGTRVRGMRMIASHEIEDTGEGVNNTLILELSGFVARMMWPIIRRSLAVAL